MSDEELDRLFREKLQSYEAKPSSRTWQNIAMDLQPRKSSGNIQRRIWMAAASVVVCVSLGLLLLPGKPPVKLQASQTNTVQPAVAAEPVEETPVKHREAKSVLFLERLASMKIEGGKQVKKYRESSRVISENIASISQSHAEYVELPVAAEAPATDLQTVVASSKPAAKQVKTAPVLALAAPEQQEEAERKGKIRSVGDIVNFVVRQVDPRKEKIIEFTSDDDGTSVSSINLGVLKIRTKQNDPKLN
ncbi:MAG: hypothetical protein ACO1NU_08015 [Arcticibacter sp.]